jgi:hypothetical protein
MPMLVPMPMPMLVPMLVLVGNPKMRLGFEWIEETKTTFSAALHSPGGIRRTDRFRAEAPLR